MRNKVLIRQLILVVLFEVLFELFAINVLRGTGAYNNYLFLFLDKCLFLTLLIILNTKLTQQKIPFSLKLNKEQRDFIIILTVILIIVGLMNTKKLYSCIYNRSNCWCPRRISFSRNSACFIVTLILSFKKIFYPDFNASYNIQHFIWPRTFAQLIFAKFFSNNSTSLSNNSYGNFICQYFY